MNYRDRLYKTIDLPSGVKVRIDKLNAFNAPFIEKRVADDNENGRRLSSFILLNKVGPLDGLKIVEKAADKASEIGIDEIEQPDIDFIVDQVLDFSGLTKRGQEARKTFPESAKNGGECRPSGEAVSGALADAVTTAAV